MATQDGSDVNWGRFWIEPTWGNQHRDLPYIQEPFNDVDAIQRWRNLGFDQSRFNGDLYDMRQPEPAWIPRLRGIFAWRCFSWSIYRITPGIVLPEHRDLYIKFREIYNIEDSNTIRRAVIFLEDWNSGHYFEINDVPVVNWRAGDGIYWDGDAPHMAGNIGRSPRYTLQITGIKNENQVT